MRTNDESQRTSTAWYSKAALTALGGLAVGSATQEVQAGSIVSWTSGATVDENVNFSSSNPGLYFNPQTGASSSPSVPGFPSGTQLAIFPLVVSGSYDTYLLWNANSSGGMATLSNGTPYTPRLAAGAPIGPSASFTPFTAGTPPFSPGNSSRTLFDPGSGNSNFGFNTDGYIGLRFGNGPSYNYGWIELSTDGSGDVTLVAGAYDTTLDEAIAAGDMGPAGSTVPAPSSLVMLASGALGLAAYRTLRARKKLAVA